MSNQRNNPKSRGSALKLSDTQLVLLSAAAQRDDHCLTATPNLKGRAAQKVAEKLIAAGLVREVKAKTGAPVWRRDEDIAQSFALKLTAAGLKAIAVDKEQAEKEVVAPIHRRAETRPNVAPIEDLSNRRGKHPRKDDAPPGDRGQPRKAGPASAPRPGSKTAAIIDLLQQDQGATIDELIAATGWLRHTTRAALTGLKKREYQIARSRSDGVTRYKIERDPALNDLYASKEQAA